jgi:N-glycosylase/DNA lyase
MKTSLWLNVDPLAEKHPNIGGYVYCINNPILLKDPDGRDPITAILEGLTAFGIEAGLDIMTNLIVKGQKTDKAFENINWKGATFEGVKATTISAFLPTGTQTVSRIARISRSKIGKLALSFVENLTTEALKNYVSGKYNDSDGDFSMDMMMEDFGNLSATAAISTLLDAGMGGKAEEMYKKFSKSNEKLAKQFKKLARNLNSSGSTQRTINNRIKKIKGAATELTKDAVKATGLKAGEETVKKVGDETQKKLRGVKD